MRSELPQLVIISDKIIQNSNQLDYEHKLLAKHPLVDRLIVSPLYSRPPIQIEDPGGGGVPSDPYDIYYIKQTVNDSLLYSGTGIKIGVLEAAWGNEYSIVDPSIQNFNFGDVIQDPNLTVSNYNFHATTVAGISSGHNGIAKNSLVYSTSFKQSGLNPYNITQALNWLNKNSSFINDNINVDIINMSFSSPTEIDILRNIGYLNRKIMIAGSGNKHLVPIEYPAAYANVFTVGATTPSGDELWNNNNDDGIGSAYINNSNLINKPNIVAPGMINLRNFPSGIDFVQGTSFSTPIVTGAIAKLIESRPVLKMFPELVYALLMTTSNQNIISNIDQQYTMNVGNKTGSGMLDISKLINNRLNTHTFNSDNFTNGKYIFNLYIDNPTNQSLHFNIAAFWLEKYENNNYKLSNYDLRVNIDENVIISNSTTNNFEYVKTVTNHNGEITVIIDSTYFSGVNTDLIGLAWSFY
ncbi:S8 family peptidase [Acholeplasma oculi]|nr:S8/S53 family peptidase [Acholeplasma oculi]